MSQTIAINLYDAECNLYKPQFKQENHVYNYMCESTCNKQGCYYMKDDCTMWRYYVNEGSIGIITRIKPVKNIYGQLVVWMNSKYYILSDLFNRAFHHDIPICNYFSRSSDYINPDAAS